MSGTGESPKFDSDAALVFAMFEGTLDQASYNALIERMRNEPQLRRMALLLAGDEETLREWAVAESVEDFRHQMNDEYFAATVRKQRRRPLRVLAAITAILACVAAFFYYYEEVPQSEIATITRSVDARWSSETPKPVKTRLLNNQLVELESGQVEITFDTGARVWLEGPVSVRLGSARSIELTRGRMAVDIDSTDPNSKDDDIGDAFEVVTPEARVVDLGTRFAVSVEGDKVDLVVYEGAVATQSLKADAAPVESRAGDAIRFDSKTGKSKPLNELKSQFSELARRLYERAIPASADHFVCSGPYNDEVQDVDGDTNGDTLFLIRCTLEVCRKAWIRFDLSSLDYDVDRPVTFTFRHNEPVGTNDFQGCLYVYSLRPGFLPSDQTQGIDWDPDLLTWENAPGNDTIGFLLNPIQCTAHGEIVVDTLDPGQPHGTTYSLTIPRLGDILQEDETVTLILCVKSQQGSSANLSIAAMDSKDVAGPELIVPLKKPNANYHYQ